MQLGSVAFSVRWDYFLVAGGRTTSVDGGHNVLDLITKCRTLCSMRSAFGGRLSIEEWRFSDDQLGISKRATTALQICAYTLSPVD